MAVVVGVPPRPIRADAARNRARVVEAAGEVFAEKGLEAGVPEVAARAGVGKATVYRSFPTKEHLVAAVMIERLRWFEAMGLEAAESKDPWAAFTRFLTTAAEAQATDRALGDSMALDIRLPELEEARAAMWRALAKLMRRAKQQGAMRTDATPADLRILFTGAARMLAGEDQHDVKVWRRYARLIAAALRS
jgi:AcrR family transcriptional regulator